MARRARFAESFQAFWPYYLQEHSRPLTRGLHVAGTSLALAVLLIGVFSGSLAWIIAAPVIGYGVAWPAHMLVERNRPATFTHPLWSLQGDLWMTLLWWTGRLEAEIARVSSAPGWRRPES